MQFFVEHARKTDVNIPVLCGGAAINSNYINRIAKKDGIYEAGIFYCGTMFDGLKTMDKLVSEEKDEFVSAWKEKISKWEESKVKQIASEDLPRSDVKPIFSSNSSKT